MKIDLPAFPLLALCGARLYPEGSAGPIFPLYRAEGFIISAQGTSFPNVFIGNVIPECLHRERHPRERNVIPAEAGIQVLTMTKQPCTYILASKKNGTLYVGVTSDLIKRVWQHRNGMYEGFTKKYHVHYLVWYESHESMVTAIKREKAIKEWPRRWKVAMIEDKNPNWGDLYDVISKY